MPASGVEIPMYCASDAISYDVSVKVGDKIYVVLYTPPLREISVKSSLELVDRRRIIVIEPTMEGAKQNHWT